MAKNSKPSVYLLYDFEELCGVFATRQKAIDAALAHLELLKKYSRQKAKQLSMGEVSFDVLHESDKTRLAWGLMVKSVGGVPLHSRKISIFERSLDQYHSLLKRHMDGKDEIPSIEFARLQR
jgi:hypothetical protein